MPTSRWSAGALVAACILCTAATAAETQGLRAAMRTLSGGRVQLLYDWSSPAQLRDWQPDKGDAPTLEKGELRFGGRRALCHVATFAGDIDIAGTWCVRKPLGNEPSCGIGIHVSPTGNYTLILKASNQRVYKHRGTNVLAWAQARCPNARPHTFRLARRGRTLKAAIDRKPWFNISDPDHNAGTIRLSAWNAHVAYSRIRITGRFDPKWLAAHPEIARQLGTVAKSTPPSQPLRRPTPKPDTKPEPTPPPKPTAIPPTAQAIRQAQPPDLTASTAVRSLPTRDQIAVNKLCRRIASEWRLAVTSNPGNLALERERAKALGCLQHINNCLAQCRKLLRFLDSRKGLDCDGQTIRDNMHLLELWKKDLASRYARALR